MPGHNNMKSSRHLVSLIVATVLALAGVVSSAPVAARADDPNGISMSKSSAGSVLLGGKAGWTLTASNPSDGVEQYNLTYVDTLPTGVTYVDGSTSPSMFGEPEVITVTDDNGTPADPSDDTTHQVLIWANVADLTLGSSSSLDYQTSVDPTLYPIGATVPNSASAYVSSDPRTVPDFDAQGNLISDPAVTSATATATTTVAAIKITKSEPSPENELLRGLGDHQTTYTVKVTNNSVDTTTDILVTDYVPAGMEFLGCGGDTITGGPEYPGASNTVATVTGCTTPTSVDTVTDPAGHPAGIYTKVTWTIGSLAASASTTVKYAAAIPQRANTDTWTGTKPTAASGEQAANLDNNNGPSTRETTTEQLLRNYVDVSANFQGAPVTATASHDVTAEDMRMQKSVNPTTFTQGSLATYTLTVDTSEYADSDNLVVTDTLPNGLCPMGTSDPGYAPITGCDPSQGAMPTNASITGVAPQADGSYILTIVPDSQALAHNSTLTITYQAMMRYWYGTGTDNDPTAADDGFTNHATITGTTTVRSDVDAPAPNGVETVNDESSATITSDSPTISKLRQANATPMKCSSDPNDFEKAPTDAAYNLGDRVCFLLSVNFPAGVNTKSPQVTDFLPTNFAYESSTVIAGDDLVSATIAPTTSTGGVIIWLLGSGSPRVVPKGALFQVVVSATVATTAPATASNPKKLDKDNLMKFRWVNTPGHSESLRDSSTVTMAPQPTVGLIKGIQQINTTVIDSGTTPSNIDGRTVVGGDKVTFRIDVNNQSASGDINGRSVSAPDVWDVLPAGVTCADIETISDSGTCYDAATPGRPALTSGDTTSSIIRWQLPDTWTLAPGAYGKLTYTMVVPAATSVSITYTNTASVASYRTATNIDDGTPVTVANYPASNVDASVPTASQLVPAASDTSNVVTPDASVTKKVTSPIATNNTAIQAVVGETATYTVGVKIPAHTSVYNAKLVDPMVTGMVFVGPATAYFSSAGTSPATESLPSGVSVDTATGTLTFPSAGYANTTDTDQLFEVTIPARVGTDSGNVQSKALTNTATFTSTTDATGATAVPARTASATLTVIAPSPTISKNASPTTGLSAGSTITYTLAAKNASGRPTMYDTWVVDCLPNSLNFVGYGTLPGGVTTLPAEAGTGTNGCATGYTRLSWNIGALAGGATTTLTYTATMSANPAAQQGYKNTATLTGSTLNDGKTDPTAPNNSDERTYSVAASVTVTAAGIVSITKTTDPANLAPGQTASYHLRVALYGGLAYYSAAVIDTLPSGMTYMSTGATSITYGDGTPTGLTLTPMTASGQNIGWSIGDVPVDANPRYINIDYTARMNPTTANMAGVTRTNTAKLSWMLTSKAMPGNAGGTWDTSSSTASVTNTVYEPAMKVAKTVDDATVEPGQTFTYTVTASNNNGTYLFPAYNLTVTDQVPAKVIVDQSTLTAISGGTVVISGTNPDGSGGTITWTVPGPIAANDHVTFTYSAKLAASSGLTSAVQTNTATITGYDSLPTSGKHYTGGTATSTVTPQFPQVTVAKAVASGPAYLGTPKTWTVTVTNSGGADARNVSVTDTLPANWVYVDGTATITVAGSPAQQIDPTPTMSGNQQVLTWANIGTVPATGTNTATIAYQAYPKDPEAITDPGVGSTKPHTNTVAVTGQDATGATGNSTGAYNGPAATASTHIDSADVKIVKTVGSIIAGQDATWTLTVTNAGPDTSVGPFVVTDTLPAGLTAVSASGTGWACSIDTTTVTCSRNGSLNSTSSLPDIKITGHIPSNTADGTDMTNTAAVTSGTYDPALGNNTDTVAGSVTQQADLSVTKHDSGDATAGHDYTWTVDVANLGPSDIPGTVTMTDTLPDGTSWVSATGTGWDCGHSGKDITCTFDAGLAAGASAPQITVVAHIASGTTGTIKNTATVSSKVPDPNPDNDTSTVTTDVDTSADLGIVKAHQGTFTAGENGVYEFTVTNYGPSDAANVKVTDTLPDGLTFVSGSGSWDCSASGQDVTCSLPGTLASGDHAAFQMTVAIDQAQVGDIENTGKVSTSTPDPNPGNNTWTDTTGTDVVSDLGITKTHTGDATAGRDLDFTLTVTNHGSSKNPGPITVTDTLPDGMSYVSANGSGWDCGHSGQNITCTRDAALDAADSDTITVTVHVAPDAGPGTLVNRANVASTTPDPNPDNNTDADTVTVKDEANIRVSKSVDDKTPNAGTKVTYTLVVTNDGPSDADSVQMSDPLAAGLTLVSVDGNGWDCADTGTVSCLGDTLAAGASHTITVVAKVGSGVANGTEIVNTATVDTSAPGDDPDDNTDTAKITVGTSADLKLAKTHDGEAVAGQNVTFDLTATNDGPSDAQSQIAISDTLPDGMTFVSSSGPWTCVQDGQKLDCTLDGSDPLLPGQSAPVLHVTAHVDSDLATADATLVNTAVVSSPTSDPDPDNNTATDPVDVKFSADLQIVKTHSDDARIGDQMRFTVQVGNAGPSTARNVQVVDPMPEGLSLVSAEGDGWTCTAVNQVATCDLVGGDLAAGEGAEPITITVLVTSDAYPSVDNTATVDSTTPDPNRDDNTSTDNVPVPPQVDLAISKSHTPEPMQVGQQAVYTLTVVNYGPTEDPGPVTVTDTLPNGLLFDPSGSDSSCTASGQDVTCTIASMKLGETVSMAVAVMVEPGAYPEVVNTASVNSDAEDTDTSNNSATDPATVKPLYQLTLDKKLSGSSAGHADWKIVVTNHGPNLSPNGATVTDDLPGYLGFDGYSGDGWTCAAAGRTVTCDYASPIPVDGTATVILHTTVADGVTEVKNTAGIVDEWGNESTSTGSGKVPTATEQLAYTGGAALGTGLLGLFLLGGGAWLLRFRRREEG